MSAVQRSVSAADPPPWVLRVCVQSAHDLPLPVYALLAPFQSQAAGRTVRQTSLLTAPCEALGDLCLRTLIRERERLENLGASARDHHTYSAQIVR